MEFVYTTVTLCDQFIHTAQLECSPSLKLVLLQLWQNVTLKTYSIMWASKVP